MSDRRFAVWAPIPDEVTLVAGPAGGGATSATTLRLVKDARGWWSPDDEAIDALDRLSGDTDYGFVLDGKGPYPDPRSLRQPHGVHELSRTFDVAEHVWRDGDWQGRELTGALIYEMHVGTFTPEGTLDAATAHLEHLRAIGVDAIEVLPVNAVNGTHNWGYDGVLWWAVQEDYGGPAAYQRFVDACHVAGIAVIQDVVYNHLGPSGNYLPLYGPYLNDGVGNTWGASPNLDGANSDEVRAYIVQNALHWMRAYHVDGLRLDAVHALHDSRATPILEELSARTAELSAELGRPLTLIAESDLNDPRVITPRIVNGLGIDAQWSDDFHHALHVNLTGETTGYYEDFAGLGALAKVFTRGFFHDGTWSSFRERNHGRPIDRATTPTTRLVVFSQDHDQIGNRAQGDRLTASLDAGSLAIAAAFTELSPFTSMLFMGEEWAASTPWQFFTSHPEKDLGEATAKGRIEEFARMGWDPASVPDPQDPQTFLRSKLDWDEARTGRHVAILDWYRDLGRLRREHPAFSDHDFADTRVRFDPDARWLTFTRGSTAVLVAANFGTSAVRIPLEPTDPRTVLLSFDGAKSTLEAHDDDRRDATTKASSPAGVNPQLGFAIEEGLEDEPDRLVVAAHSVVVLG